MPLHIPTVIVTRPKQIWAPAITRADISLSVQYPANIKNAQTASIIFKLPVDFTSFTTATLVLYGGATLNYNLRIRVRAGACAENFATHLGTDTRDYALTLSVFSCIDIVPFLATAFAELAAGDHVLVDVRNNTSGTVIVYGLDVRYD